MKRIILIFIVSLSFALDGIYFYSIDNKEKSYKELKKAYSKLSKLKEIYFL